MEDNNWLLLFLLFCMHSEIRESVNKEFEQRKEEEEYQRNCPHVEWEQDMNAHIPFCKLDGDFCKMQCRRRYGNNPCI